MPSLRVSSPDYDKLISEASRKLWALVADSNVPEVAEAACDALSAYKIDDYKLKDIPEVCLTGKFGQNLHSKDRFIYRNGALI